MKNQCIVIIPSYKPKTDFIFYTKELSNKVKNIIVINDGSSQEYDGIFDEIKKISNVEVISYKVNQGKGYALKQGFLRAINNFDSSDIIVTADSDGQHKIKDVEKVYYKAKENPNSLVLGSRDFSLSNIPKKSKMGNLTMRKMFKMFYGGNVYDTQTGLRGFSINTAKEFLKVKGNRFEYELAVLIHAQKSGVEILETKIETVYPNEPKKHETHFKSVRDSLKVLGVMLKNVSGYFISTILSGIVDLGLFSLLSLVVFNKLSPAFLFISVAVSRIVSSFVNYFINFKYVFKAKEKTSIFKYYVLWASILILSYLNVALLRNLFDNIVVVKLIGDLLLGIISYEIQCRWVFKRKENGRFYGPLANLCKFIFKVFTKKYKCEINRENEPCIYVCRHLNMHGPYTTIKSLDFDVHPMVLSVFFDKKESYKHLKDFTFSKKKNKKAKKFSIKAKISSWFLSKLITSLEGIPVYRGSNKSIITLKKSLNYLLEGENIIVFPDIEYSKDYSVVSDIYDGFLLLLEMYKNKTGKPLKILPLYIDENNREVVKGNEIVSLNYKEERNAIKNKLIVEINQKKINENEIFINESIVNNL